MIEVRFQISDEVLEAGLQQALDADNAATGASNDLPTFVQNCALAAVEAFRQAAGEGIAAKLRSLPPESQMKMIAAVDAEIAAAAEAKDAIKDEGGGGIGVVVP